MFCFALSALSSSESLLWLRSMPSPSVPLVDSAELDISNKYRPQTKFWQSNIFTGICLSRGGFPACITGYMTRGSVQPPLWMQTSQLDADPLRMQTPRIQSTSGRYATYWNAHLLYLILFSQYTTYVNQTWFTNYVVTSVNLSDQFNKNALQ